MAAPGHDENTPLSTLPTLNSFPKPRRSRPPLALQMRVANAGVITPPPEQMSSSPSTSSSSGRKRVRSVTATAQSAQAQSSPNPKARKQFKTQQESPSKRRTKAMRDKKSTSSSPTGSVRYSPPREQFTPPRTIYIPVAPPSTRRGRQGTPMRRARSSTPSRARGGTPIPPGSPGEDPILLVGPEPDWAALARDLEPQPKEEEIDVVLPASPTLPTDTSEQENNNNVTGYSIFNTPVARDDPFARMGDAPSPAASDDDMSDEVVEEFEVPLKQDPPTERTKARMDRFGRPSSPYPLQRGETSLILEEDEDEDDDTNKDGLPQQILPDPESPLSKRSSFSSRSGSPLVRLASSPGKTTLPRLSKPRISFIASPVGESPSSTLFSTGLPNDTDIEMHGTERDVQDEPVKRSGSLFGPKRLFAPQRSLIQDSEDESPPTTSDRSMHMSELDQSFSRSRISDTPVNGDSEEESDLSITGPGVIQISSKDPLAAARAAAILKKHHKYIQEGIMHGRKSQSRSSKSSPSFSVVSNDDLLRLSEAEIELEAASTPKKTRRRQLEAWAKEDWKLLDACFSAVREESGKDVEEVQPRDVVQRFIEVAALREDDLLGDWTRDKLLRRTIALRPKQRGNPANSSAGTPRSSRAPSETPSMRVPDFTPQILEGVTSGRLYADLNRLEGAYVPPIKRPDFSRVTSSSSDVTKKSQPPVARLTTPESSSTPRTVRQSSIPAHGTFESPRKIEKPLSSVPPELLVPRYKSDPPPATPQRVQHSVDPPPSTARRMMGYLSSWLGVAKNKPAPSRLPQPVARLGLPPPPPARPRAVATPPRRTAERTRLPSVPLHAPPPVIREPTPEVLNPLEEVELQHAEQVRHEWERPAPHRDSVELAHAEPVQRPIERVVPPRDQVELNHVSPPPSTKPREKIEVRPRTASGSSVRDLVKSFEASNAVRASGRNNADLELAKAKMRRTRSLQNLAPPAQASAPVRTTSQGAFGSTKPAWR